MTESPIRPLLHQVHHFGYVVDDLKVAVDHAVRTTGAGPFFFAEHVQLGEVTSGGKPALFDHSSAIGQLGDVRIEFMIIHDSAPSAVREALAVPGTPRLHHVAWAVEDWDDVVATLEAEGAPSYMQARFGTMHTSYHDASDLFGHHIEVHHRTPDFEAFFQMVEDASINWDGSDAFRALSL
ncbi:VOC family protein [Nesterenkonia haasae]|uniref:VOC family protein n=1 Tax=Nesterenkonia haasae TaxID=2587813 RepID=UPI0013911B2C|nr:VOC family protein [Nesterenkonia haasae]